MKTSLFLVTAVSAMLVTGIAAAESHNYHVEADSEQELPTGASSSALAPEADFTVDTDTATFCGTIDLKVTSDNGITQIHVHEGADTVESGAILLNIMPTPLPLTAIGADGKIVVNFKNVPADILSKLTGQDNYLNFHTTAFGNGAARGQLQLDDESTAQACAGTAIDYQDPTGADAGTTSSSSSSSSSSGATTTSDAGTVGTTAPTTEDDSGCNTTGSSSSGTTMAALMGLGIVVAAASRKKNKKA